MKMYIMWKREIGTVHLYDFMSLGNWHVLLGTATSYCLYDSTSTGTILLGAAASYRFEDKCSWKRVGLKAMT
jgi:hypothetical protein